MWFLCNFPHRQRNSYRWIELQIAFSQTYFLFSFRFTDSNWFQIMLYYEFEYTLPPGRGEFRLPKIIWCVHTLAHVSPSLTTNTTNGERFDLIKCRYSNACGKTNENMIIIYANRPQGLDGLNRNMNISTNTIFCCKSMGSNADERCTLTSTTCRCHFIRP